MGETRVDLQHLLEDLRDAYTGAIEETILTEVVANALDSGAGRVRLQTDPSAATLTVVDDGRGMQRRELARYHDVAASTKARGDGIGFAGVGIKLGLLVSSEVVTETRRGKTHVATRWHLASRHRAPWKWIPPPGLTASRGTAVRLTLANPLAPLLDAGFLEETIRHQFEPLLDPAFDDLLGRHYAGGIRFEVNGRELSKVQERSGEYVPVAIRLGRRRTPSAIGYIERVSSLRPDRAGIAISTFGKIIKRGWDWLGLAPASGVQIGGLIEAPELAACLTLSKNDFVRTGSRGALYLAYRKAIQEIVSNQLARWGDRRESEQRPRIVRLERDLERVLEDLADDFPLLRSLVDRRRGGQKQLPMPGRGDDRVPAPLFAAAAVDDDVHDAAGGGVPAPSSEEPGRTPGSQTSSPGGPSEGERTPGRSSAAGTLRQDEIATAATPATIPGRRRPARYGLLVQFESRPGDPELGRLVENTVWINEDHPAYVRAVASRSIGYHTALTVALALAPLTVEPRDEHRFINQFLACWGGAQTSPRFRHRRKR